MDALCHFSSDDNITALATKLCAILSSKVTVMQSIIHNTTSICTISNVFALTVCVLFRGRAGDVIERIAVFQNYNSFP